MDKIVIIGGGDHAKVVIAVIRSLGKYDIEGYVAADDRGDILGVRWLGNDEVLQELHDSGQVKYAAMGIGISIPGKRRLEIAHRIKAAGYDFPPVISPNSIVSVGVEVGEGVFINDGAAIGPDVAIGGFSIINRNSSIDHDCNIGKCVHIAPGSSMAGGIEVGNFVNLGIAACVTEHRKIVDNCIIGAGAVIVDDCTVPGTYIGVPGKLKQQH